MEEEVNRLSRALSRLKATLFRPGADTALESFGMTNALQRKFRIKKFTTFEDLRALELAEVQRWINEDAIRKSDVKHLTAQIEAAILAHEEKMEGLGARKPGQGKPKINWKWALPRLRVTLNALASGIMNHSDAQIELETHTLEQLSNHSGLVTALKIMGKNDIPSLQGLNTGKLKELADEHEYGPEEVENFRTSLDALVKRHFAD